MDAGSLPDPSNKDTAMSSRAKEFAKFVSGIAAHETVGHWWLGVWGRDLMPIKFFGITFTAEYNMILMAVWPLVLAALVSYAWIRRSAGERAPLATPRSA